MDRCMLCNQKMEIRDFYTQYHTPCKYLIRKQRDLLNAKNEIEDDLLNIEWEIFRLREQNIPKPPTS